MAISLNLPIYQNVYFWCFFEQKKPTSGQTQITKTMADFLVKMEQNSQQS